MSVTVMLTAETAFSFQLKLLVAPQSCLTSQLLPVQIACGSTELPDLTAAACTDVRTDQTYNKIHT